MAKKQDEDSGIPVSVRLRPDVIAEIDGEIARLEGQIPGLSLNRGKAINIMILERIAKRKQALSEKPKKP